MLRYLIATLCLMASVSVSANIGLGNYRMVNPLNVGELEIKFGGWSNHFGTDSGDKYEYNESHNGFGLEYFFGLDGRSPHRFGAGFWTMHDSYDKAAYNVGVVYKYDTMTGNRILDMFDINLAAYYMERTKRIRDIDTYETIRIEDMSGWLIHPYITFQPIDALSFDLMYMPKPDSSYNVETIFVRASLNTNAIRRVLRF